MPPGQKRKDQKYADINGYVPERGDAPREFNNSPHHSEILKTVIVRRVPSGPCFVSSVVEDENPVPDPTPETEERVVGVDLNLHDFVVLSTGEKIPHPHWWELTWYRLRIRERQWAKESQGIPESGKNPPPDCSPT
ncbi:MAG: hypothetical protein OWU33_13195 [Firmicutes bacterium]|nr:hypothetical protein [Bacillota bacterium]